MKEDKDNDNKDHERNTIHSFSSYACTLNFVQIPLQTQREPLVFLVVKETDPG